MKRLFAAALLLALSGPAFAQLYTLTVDLPARFDNYSAGQRVLLLRGRIGGSLNTYRQLTPDAQGQVSTDIPPSANGQEYAIRIGGSRIKFEMPARNSSLASLIVQPGEQGPCTVSAAEPLYPSPGDLWCHPTSRDMSFRGEGEWHTVGASESATIANGSITTAKLADGAVTSDKLAQAVRDRYDAAIKISDTPGSEQPTLNGRDLDFVSANESITRSLELPGITVEDQGDRQGNTDEVHTLNFSGDGVAATVNGTRATITINFDGDYASLTGRPDSRIDELEDFQEDLSTSSPIGTNPHDVTISLLNTWAAIGTLELPRTTPDRDLVVVIEDIGEAPRARSTIEFDTLLESARLATPNDGDAGVGTEGVEFVQDSPGNNRYWLGVTAANRLYVASDEAGNLRITLTHSGPDVTSHLRPCPDGQIYKWLSGVMACAADNEGTGGGDPNPQAATQAEAQAGTETGLRSWSPLRVREGVRAVTDNRLNPDPATYTASDTGTFGAWDEGTNQWVNAMMGTGFGFDPVDDEWEVRCPVGQVLKGTGLTTAATCQADATGGGGTAPTVQNVYPPAKQIIVAGHGVTVTADDTAETLTLEAGVPVVSEVPENPYLNERIILDAEDDFPGDYVGYQNEAASSEIRIRYDLPGAPVNGPAFIECYSAEWGDQPNETARRDKCYVITGGTYSMPADAQVRLYRSGSTRTWHEISDTAPISGLAHWFEIAGLSFADISDTGYTYGRNFRSVADSYLLYLNATLPPGDYSYAGHGEGTAGWVGTPGTCAPWACRGDTSSIPRSKLPREYHALLIDGPGIGFSTTDSSTDRFRASPNGFDPAYDLDDPLSGAAIIEVAGTYSIPAATRSVNTIGFNNGATAANAVLTHDFSGLVRASSITATADYAPAANEYGVKVPGTATNIYSGSTALGEVALYLAHDSGNVVGYVVGYDGASGSARFSVAVDLAILVEHSDPGPNAGAKTTFTSKLVSITAAAGSTTTPGHHTNRKTVTADTSKVVVSDWGIVDLVEDATATAGITVVSDEIVFAQAGRVVLDFTFASQANDGGGAGRNINVFRLRYTRGLSVTHPPRHYSSSCYTKTTSFDTTAQSELQQGPRMQWCHVDTNFMVQAGDKVAIEWRSYIQTSDYVELIPAFSGIGVEIAQ